MEEEEEKEEHLVCQYPFISTPGLIPIHLHSILPHEEQVSNKSLKVHLAQHHALQNALTCSEPCTTTDQSKPTIASFYTAGNMLVVKKLYSKFKIQQTDFSKSSNTHCQ